MYVSWFLGKQRFCLSHQWVHAQENEAQGSTVKENNLSHCIHITDFPFCMWQKKRFLVKRIAIFENTYGLTSLFSSVTVKNPETKGRGKNLSGCQSAFYSKWIFFLKSQAFSFFLILSCPPLMYERVWIIPHKVHFMQLGITRKAFST